MGQINDNYEAFLREAGVKYANANEDAVRTLVEKIGESDEKWDAVREMCQLFGSALHTVADALFLTYAGGEILTFLGGILMGVEAHMEIRREQKNES